MSTVKISVGLMAFSLLALTPFVSMAYFTTSQAATAINSTVAMYTISYAFGREDEDIYMPIMTQRTATLAEDSQKVGYSFTENGNQIRENGTAVALVLSSAPVVNGMYKIEKGTVKSMVLFALLVTEPNQHEADYALQVTHLPFYIDRGDGHLEAHHLNVTELQYYVTKEVELNSGNFQ